MHYNATVPEATGKMQMCGSADLPRRLTLSLLTLNICTCHIDALTTSADLHFTREGSKWMENGDDFLVL